MSRYDFGRIDEFSGTDSSAYLVNSAVSSVSEYIATVSTSNSLHARITLIAISPRFATNTLLNMI